MVRVFLVDDHEIVRRGIREMFDNEPDMMIVGEAASVTEALRLVPDAGADVAILDVRLPDGTGVELCRELRSQLPQLQCLMLTSYSDDDALLDAVMAGAAGFLLKRVLGVDLAGAVRTVAEGRSLLNPRDIAALMNRLRNEKPDPLAELSQQEHAVFNLVGEGLTNKQIGERMFLSDKTVKNYVSQILTKLNLERRAQVAVMAANVKQPKPDPGT